jgi:hypothetical protein
MTPTPRRTLVVTVAIAWCATVLAAAAQAPARPESHARERLTEYNVALGVECTHCHVAGKFEDDSKPQKDAARKMAEMTAQLNARLRGVGEVRCWTCHAGQAQPAPLPEATMNAELARWPASIASAPEAVKLRMTMYSASTGLRCAQCHDATNWKRVDTDRMRLVPKMLSLFQVIQPLVAPGSQVQCFTCHKGSNKPQKDAPKG